MSILKKASNPALPIYFFVFRPFRCPCIQPTQLGTVSYALPVNDIFKSSNSEGVFCTSSRITNGVSKDSRMVIGSLLKRNLSSGSSKDMYVCERFTDSGSNSSHNVVFPVWREPVRAMTFSFLILCNIVSIILLVRSLIHYYLSYWLQNYNVILQIPCRHYISQLFLVFRVYILSAISFVNLDIFFYQ